MEYAPLFFYSTLADPNEEEKPATRKGLQTYLLVDPKGIEPSNLTDANRALSQLSYGPIFRSAGCLSPSARYIL